MYSSLGSIRSLTNHTGGLDTIDDGQAGRQADRQAGRQAGREADRETGREGDRGTGREGGREAKNN